MYIGLIYCAGKMYWGDQDLQIAISWMMLWSREQLMIYNMQAPPPEIRLVQLLKPSRQESPNG